MHQRPGPCACLCVCSLQLLLQGLRLSRTERKLSLLQPCSRCRLALQVCNERLSVSQLASQPLADRLLAVQASLQLLGTCQLPDCLPARMSCQP